MTTRMLTAMFVLSGGVLLGAQGDDLFVNVPRPMAAMAGKIAQQTGWTITYEDPSYQYAADIAVPFVFTLDAEKHKDAVKAISELVDAFEMRTGGQKFKVIVEKIGWIHLVPQRNRDKAGTWAEQRPMLDTRITLPAGRRKLAEFVNQFKEALNQASGGRRIYIGAMPLNVIMNTEIDLPAFKNTQARAVLREALSRADVKLSWQLFGGPGDEDQFLNVHVVGSRLGPAE